MLLKKDIFKVIRNRDNTGLTDLLNRYPNLINKKSLNGYSLLEMAIITQGRNNDIIKTLVEKGADVNYHSPKMKTPLSFILVRNNNSDAIKILLENGLNTKIKDNNGYSLLEIAFFYQANKTLDVLNEYMNIREDIFVLLEQEDNEAFITEFCKEKRNKAYINQIKGKYSLIEKAVINENRQLINFLLKQPYINLNRLNKAGYNLSARITMHGNEDILQAFIDAGFLYNNNDNQKRNTLYYAIENKNIKAINILLNNKAILFSNKKYALSKDSCLIKAYQSHCFEITHLIYQYALKQVSHKKEVYSPFLYFLSVGLFSHIESYKKHYPLMDYYETDINGLNCLHLTIKHRHHKFLNYILANLDINKLNTPDKQGFYPCDYLLHSSKNNIRNFVSKIPDEIFQPCKEKPDLSITPTETNDIKKSMQPFAIIETQSENDLTLLSLLDRTVYTQDASLFQTLYELGLKFSKLNIKSLAVMILAGNENIKIESSVNSYHYRLWRYSKTATQKKQNQIKKKEFIIYLLNNHFENNIDFPIFDASNSVCDLAKSCINNNIHTENLNDEQYFNLTFLELMRLTNPDIYAYLDSYLINKHMTSLEITQNNKITKARI